MPRQRHAGGQAVPGVPASVRQQALLAAPGMQAGNQAGGSPTARHLPSSPAPPAPLSRAPSPVRKFCCACRARPRQPRPHLRGPPLPPAPPQTRHPRSRPPHPRRSPQQGRRPHCRSTCRPPPQRPPPALRSHPPRHRPTCLRRSRPPAPHRCRPPPHHPPHHHRPLSPLRQSQRRRPPSRRRCPWLPPGRHSRSPCRCGLHTQPHPRGRQVPGRRHSAEVPLAPRAGRKERQGRGLTGTGRPGL